MSSGPVTKSFTIELRGQTKCSDRHKEENEECRYLGYVQCNEVGRGQELEALFTCLSSA